MVGIYKITNKLDNKCYIGQSIDIETRWKQHIYEGKKLRHKYKFYLALNKYGAENFLFEVIEECSLDTEILNNRERYWIEYYNSYEEGYNSTRGGQGEDSWIYDPQVIRDLWDEGYSFGEIIKIVGCSKGIVQQRLQGYSDYNATTSHSRGAIYAIKQGKMNHLKIGENYTFSNEQAIFFTKGIEVHQYTIDGQYVASYPTLSAAARAVGASGPGSECNISRIFDKTTNQKLAYGFQWSKEKVDKLPPVPAHNAKLVKCIETGQIFHSVVEAAKWCGLKSSGPIKDYCRHAGNYKSAGKHPKTGEKLHWEYVD